MFACVSFSRFSLISLDNAVMFNPIQSHPTPIRHKCCLSSNMVGFDCGRHVEIVKAVEILLIHLIKLFLELHVSMDTNFKVRYGTQKVKKLIEAVRLICSTEVNCQGIFTTLRRAIIHDAIYHRKNAVVLYALWGHNSDSRSCVLWPGNADRNKVTVR